MGGNRCSWERRSGYRAECLPAAGGEELTDTQVGAKNKVQISQVEGESYWHIPGVRPPPPERPRGAAPSSSHLILRVTSLYVPRLVPRAPVFDEPVARMCWREKAACSGRHEQTCCIKNTMKETYME